MHPCHADSQVGVKKNPVAKPLFIGGWTKPQEHQFLALNKNISGASSRLYRGPVAKFLKARVPRRGLLMSSSVVPPHPPQESLIFHRNQILEVP